MRVDVFYRYVFGLLICETISRFCENQETWNYVFWILERRDNKVACRRSLC